MERRFENVEGQEEIGEEDQEQYRLIREMSVDNDKHLPDAKTRHWMVAQTHAMQRDGVDQMLDEVERTMLRADPDAPVVSHKPMSEVDKQRAKKAYDVVQAQIK